MKESTMEVTTRTALRNIAIDMERNHLDRKDEIRGLMLAAISREHILFLGPPGSDKTRMSIDFASYFEDSKFFFWLMGAFTTPDEIFGTTSLASLKEDVVKRIPTNKLPVADFAMLDEIFKASSAINNTLLHIMQERMYDFGGVETESPLQFVIAGSNELPADDDKLRALYDRFSLRYNVEYIGDDLIFDKLLTMFINHRHNQGIAQTIVHETAHITLEALNKAQIECAKLPFSDGAIESIKMLWNVCLEMKIVVSERRWGKLLNIMQADAWYEGQEQVESINLMVGCHMLWDEPEQISNIRKTVQGCIDPDLTKAQALEEAADAVKMEFASQKRTMSSGEVAQAMESLKEHKHELKKLKQSTSVQVIGNKIMGYLDEMATHIRNS